MDGISKVQTSTKYEPCCCNVVVVVVVVVDVVVILILRFDLGALK
jgi:hypothetical protein